MEEFWRSFIYTRCVFGKVFQNYEYFGRVLEELLVILRAFSERSSKIMSVLEEFWRVILGAFSERSSKIMNILEEFWRSF